MLDRCGISSMILTHPFSLANPVPAKAPGFPSLKGPTPVVVGHLTRARQKVQTVTSYDGSTQT